MSTQAGRTGTWSLWAAATLVLGVHLGLLHHFIAPSAMFSDSPLRGGDYDTHVGQAYRMLRSLDEWGQSWSYDVQLLAGHPAGTIFDADNKGWGYFTYALYAVGVPPGLAFNLFAVLAHLLLLPVMFASARLFGLSGRASVAAMGMASMLWLYDSWSRWLWWVGMVSYGFAGYMSLLPLALFYGFMQRAPLPGGWGWASGCAIALALVHTIHPYSFWILALPMAVLYWQHGAQLSRGKHAAVAAIAAFTLAVNAQWLLAAATHWHYILNSAYYAQTGLAFLASDFFDLLRSPTDTGVIGTRTAFRFLYLALAVGALWQWRQQRDPRFALLATGIGGTFTLAYLGAYIPGASQIQPYRHVLPMGMLAIIPAAWLLDWWWTERPLRTLAGPARAVVYVAMMAGAQHLASQILYFHSHALPEVLAPMHGGASPLHALGYPDFGYYASKDSRHFALPHPPQLQPETDALVAWTSKHIGLGGRALVEEMEVGERIAWRTSVEVIGGFRERNIEHSHANLFRRFEDRNIPESVLRDWLITYGVGWVITRDEHPELAHMTELLGPPVRVHQRLAYRVRIPVSKLGGSPGQIFARTNRIRVTGSDPGADVIVRYHYHEALRCRPECKVVREPISYDKVGLMRVPAPHPADFTIENAYP